ncbi:hypothetical protein J6590_012074 [Homalodisca vitripennis]|nr:hypothetical protein J6590_012074 [Homalodisca vitripennis]
MMDPNSVPDIIPVENVSQSLSQNSTDRCLSQSLTDFTSPVELDEATKLAYQRLAAESPGFVYPRGPDMLEAQAREVQMSAPVRSQYFSSTPATVMQDSYQPTPYSPPTHINTSSVLSPPAGNLGMFSFGKDTSQNSCDKQMEKQKSPDGGFNFNFMSGPSSTSKKTKGRYRQCEAARCECLLPSASGNAQVAAAAFIVMATIIRKNNRKSDVNPVGGSKNLSKSFRCGGLLVCSAELCLVRCEADSAGIHLTHSSERGTFEHCSKTDKHTARLTLCDANAS